MWWLSKTIIYQSVLFLAAISGLIHYKKMDKASRLIVWFILSTFISEAIAMVLAIKYSNSLIVFHVYNPIQLLLLSLYFNSSIKKFDKRKIGWTIGIAGIILALINSIFFQPPLKVFNTNFLIVESFVVIGMCLYSFYDLLLGEEIDDVYSSNRFWYTALLLTFWSFTFCYWLIWAALYKLSGSNFLWLDIMIWTINVLCYSGFAIVFLSFRKMKKV